MVDATRSHNAKASALRRLFAAPNPIVIAGAHDGLSARLVEEALRRARAYADAGADAILVHSNHSTVDEVARFADDWDRLTPLVCVPTTYASADVETLARLGFKMIIFANHGLRASIRAMQETFGSLRSSGAPASVEDRIVP